MFQLIKYLNPDQRKEWKRVTKNPNVLRVYLHGSWSKGKRQITNDIDILIVLGKVKFSNWANENLLGFEHIRHEGIFDRYLTDEVHSILAKAVLRIDNKLCLFSRKKRLERRLELLDISKFFFNPSLRETEKRIQKIIEANENYYSQNHKELMKEFYIDASVDFFFWDKGFNDICRITNFWLFTADKSWFNFWAERIGKPLVGKPEQPTEPERLKRVEQKLESLKISFFVI